MDVAELSRMVGDLLLDHDRVGLPGVGTFVAEVAPATFSDKGYTINPPYRRLSFTQQSVEEDVLAEYYASSENVDKQVAKAFLTAFLSELKGILLERKTITFPGLGRLRTTRNDELFFVPDEDLDIFPDGFGLGSVSLKTHHETDEEVSIAVSDLAAFIESQPVPADEEPAPADEEPLPETQPAPEVSDVSMPQPSPEHIFEAVEMYDEEEVYTGPARRKWLIALLCVIGLAVLLLAAFLILAHVAPDFIDSILYTEEELRIINY